MIMNNVMIKLVGQRMKALIFKFAVFCLWLPLLVLFKPGVCLAQSGFIKNPIVGGYYADPGAALSWVFWKQKILKHL
jgi:hypothetical protein